MHAGARGCGVPFGNAGDQVGGPGQSQGARKATDGRYDLPFQPERNQGLIDWSLVETPPRDADVPARRIRDVESRQIILTLDDQRSVNDH